MKLSSKTLIRGALLVSALTLSALATSRPALAACTNGSNQWVYDGCCVSHTRYKGQSCIFGVWTDNGAVMCSGLCMF
jgi:hypothetical protein